MRALVIHSYYRSENASGENLSVTAEIKGLRDLGWDVEVISSDGDIIGTETMPLRDVALRPIYSRSSVRRIEEAVQRFRPHVALVENLFPLHSPWAIKTLHSLGLPVAAGVRSYRMVCAASTLYRDGHQCHDCIGSRLNLAAIRHGCYHGSSALTVPVAASLMMHQRTFASIDALLAVSEHVRDVLVDSGFDAGRITVRPNFVDDPGEPADDLGAGFLFAGRLTNEKGVEPMLEGWRRSGVWKQHPLRIAGSGPLEAAVRASARHHRVEMVGLQPYDRLLGMVRAAAVTVVPSMWPEPFGRGVIEAAARGRAALVTDSGGLGELVVDGTSGWVCAPDTDGLADGFRRAADQADQLAYGIAARSRFVERYTRGISLGILDDVLTRLAHSGPLDSPV